MPSKDLEERRTGQGPLLLLAAGGMEVSWLYAWATFLFIAIFNRPFPLPEAAGAFALAAALTFFSRGRGWLVIQTLGLQVLGFVLAGLRILYVFHHPPAPFLGFSWLIPFLRSPRPPMEWFLLAVALFWALSFWVGGVTLARRSRTYVAVCSRFDLGLAFLFLLYLTKFLLFVRGGITVEASISELLLLPFFVQPFVAQLHPPDNIPLYYKLFRRETGVYLDTKPAGYTCQPVDHLTERNDIIAFMVHG